MDNSLFYANCNIFLNYFYKHQDFVRPNEIKIQGQPENLAGELDLFGAIRYLSPLLEKQVVKGATTNTFRYRLQDWARTEIRYMPDKFKDDLVGYFIGRRVLNDVTDNSSQRRTLAGLIPHITAKKTVVAKKTIREITIGVIITVVGGLILWLILRLEILL